MPPGGETEEVRPPTERPLGVTDRERDVLVLVAKHLTNAEIAERLFLSVRTVESHVSSLIRKLEVGDRRSLARRADQRGLLKGRRGWPAAGSGLVGRQAETGALTAALARHRMVTVIGPGGVGKTRLATHTAVRVADDRADGGWFVDLSQISEPRGVVPAVASAIGLLEHPGRSVEEALSAVLARSDGVLLLDNCEHLLAEVRHCVSRLVAECPGVTVVATSRARLGAAYEWVYQLPGLQEDDAVRLFCERAAAAGGDVVAGPGVAELCSRLDGMALAIELAAARYPSLGLDGLTAAMADPLRLLGSDDGTRQRSMRATLRWSVDLLDDDGRALFAACSVFASWFTVDAARRVAWPERSEAAVAHVLAALTDQHLMRVQVGAPTTYRLQEVVRQYASDLLAGQGAALKLRQARWVAEELAALIEIEHDEAWCQAFDRLAVEVRAQLGRTAGDRELGESFAEQLVLRGRLEEAQHRFEVLAAAAPDNRVRLLRLAAGAAAARLVGDETMRLLSEAAGAAQTAGDKDSAADALAWSVIYASLAPGIMAHPPTADLTERRLAEARRLAPARSAAAATVAVATAAWLPDEHPEALSAGRRGAKEATETGQPVVASAALDCVCVSHLLRWEYAAALATVAERGEVLDPQPVAALTAYAFNDYLLMGCEVSLAAGDLRGAAAYADRLATLPCYRDYVHPALARRLEVDVLSGDLAGAVRHGELFLASWDRAGRHRASTLGVGAYALSLAHGLLDQNAEREDWRRISQELVAGGIPSLDGIQTGWAPTLDAWLLLDRGDAETAVERLVIDLDDPLWRAWNTALWRPWYAAAWAEAAALASLTDLDARLAKASAATRENPVAAALVRRAAALAAGDQHSVTLLASTFDELGSTYQRDRSLRLGTKHQRRSGQRSPGSAD